MGCKVNAIKDELTNDIEIIAETCGSKCIIRMYSLKSMSGVKKEIRRVYKTYLKNRIKIIKSSNNFVWIEVENSTIQNLQENILVVATYINDVIYISLCLVGKTFQFYLWGI